jgi:hypothetical protein
MNLISKARFDALASYCRDPLASALAIELAWLAFADEQLLATRRIQTVMPFVHSATLAANCSAAADILQSRNNFPPMK